MVVNVAKRMTVKNNQYGYFFVISKNIEVEQKCIILSLFVHWPTNVDERLA